MANDKNFKVKNGVSVGTDIVLEGTSYNTTLTKTNPSAMRTITFPDASGTVVLGNGLTTYSVKASSTTGGANLDLDAAGANSNTDSVKFAGAGITTVTQTDNSTITITSTEADTLASVTGRGATTSTAVSITNTTQATDTSSGALVLSGGLGIAKNLHVGQNIVVGGNLTVQGTQTTISTSTLTVTDKTIELGVVATPTDITADGGGIELKGDTDKTILWDNANDNWTLSEHVNIPTGKVFKINNTSVLSSTQVLGKGFTNAAGEIVTTDGTQTLTNKTISGGSASNLTGLSMAAGVTITEFSSDGTLAGDSNDAVPTESAVKTYVDDALTTYSIKASSTVGGANLDLDAAGANTNTDTVKFAGAGTVSVAQTDANTITVTGATPGNGGLTLQVGGTAAATNNTVTVSTGTGFTANASTGSTYELRIGPALTALAGQMTGAGTGFLRKNGADTFSLDTTTYLSAEADTLATVTGRGATTATDITLGNGTTTSYTYFGGSLNNYLTTTGNGRMRIKTKDQTTTYGRDVYIEAGNTSAANEYGGAVLLNAGDGTGTSGEGGAVTVYAGDGMIPGTITLLAGTATSLNSGTATGGSLTIQAGSSSVTSGAAVGGNVLIKGGDAPISDGATKTGGNVYISGGGISGSNTLRYGNVYIGIDQNGSSGGTQEVHIGNASSKNYIKGLTEYTGSIEVLNTKTSATGTVVHNLNEGNTWYHSSISANFTANFTNVPTTNNRTIVCTLILAQGATAYIPNAVQIDGVAQTINWTGHSGVPTGDANDTNIATFILIRQSSTWSVLGSVVNNPASVSGTLQTITNSGATSSNAISITNATDSSSTTTGALIVTGGVGVGGKVYVGDNLSVSGQLIAETLDIQTTGTGYIGNITSTTGSAVLRVRSTAGAVTNNFSGFHAAGGDGKNLSISAGTSGSVNTTGLESGTSDIFIRPLGYDFYIQSAYNVDSFKVSHSDKSVDIFSTTASTSTTTGALKIAGGVGIVGNLNVGGVVDVTGSSRSGITAVAALDINCTLGNFFTKTINSNSTFTFSNPPASRAYGFTLELTHTSGSVTWPGTVTWPSNTAPTLTTGKTHLFTFITDDGGTKWRGASLVDYTT